MRASAERVTPDIRGGDLPFIGDVTGAMGHEVHGRQLQQTIDSSRREARWENGYCGLCMSAEQQVHDTC